MSLRLFFLILAPDVSATLPGLQVAAVNWSPSALKGDINKGIEASLLTTEPGKHHPETAVNKTHLGFLRPASQERPKRGLTPKGQQPPGHVKFQRLSPSPGSGNSLPLFDFLK